MSLINEALKRTRDSAYQSVQTPTAPAPEYQFQTEDESRRLKTLVVAAALIVVLALAVIIGFAVHLANQAKRAKNNPVPDAVTVAAEPKPAPPVVQPAPVPATNATEDQIVAKVMEKIKAEQPAAPAIPKLVLQGITYAAADKEAMINGVTVHEGEDVEGARVVTIESRHVKLDFKGQEIALRLP